MKGRLKMFVAAGATALVAGAVGSGVAIAGGGGADGTEVALNNQAGSGAPSGSDSTGAALNKDSGASTSAAKSGGDEDDGGAGDDDGTEVAIKGDGLSRASAAALDYTGEGTVSGTEEGDEESYYEVEVTLDDGSQVDVQLNKSFEVVSSENDGVEDGN